MCSHYISSTFLSNNLRTQGIAGHLLETLEIKRDAGPQAIAFIPALTRPSEFICFICWASTKTFYLKEVFCAERKNKVTQQCFLFLSPSHLGLCFKLLFEWSLCSCLSLWQGIWVIPSLHPCVLFLYPTGESVLDVGLGDRSPLSSVSRCCSTVFWYNIVANEKSKASLSCTSYLLFLPKRIYDFSLYVQCTGILPECDQVCILQSCQSPHKSFHSSGKCFSYLFVFTPPSVPFLLPEFLAIYMLVLPGCPPSHNFPLSVFLLRVLRQVYLIDLSVRL